MRAYLQRYHPAHLFLLIALGAALVTFVWYRQQYVGAIDWYAYHQQAELLQQGRIELPIELPVDKFPAAVPMGYVPIGDRALPQYPPGFPLLLAAGGWFGLAFFVPALLGVFGAVLVYLLVRELADPWTSASFAAVWAFFPIVAYASTNLMSDMAAAVCLLAGWWLYRRERLLLSALVLGFGFSVRPTNVLFLLAFALPLWRDRRLIRYGLWLAVPCALYGVYNHAVYGAPWRTGYSDVGSVLLPEVFASHFTFYLRETWRQLGWPLAGLALLGLTVPHRDRWFYVAWFLPFLGFYSFWWAGGDRWWWTRFLLPAYPPLFFLAAIGFGRLRQCLLARCPGPAWQPYVTAALLATLALLPLRSVRLTRKEGDVWVRLKGMEYYHVVQRLQAVAAPGSYVGSVEFGGALLVYSGLHPFVATFPGAVDVVAEAHRRDRDVFLVVEPWHRDQAVIRRLLDLHAVKRLPDLPVWEGLQLYQLSPRAAP